MLTKLKEKLEANSRIYNVHEQSSAQPEPQAPGLLKTHLTPLKKDNVNTLPATEARKSDCRNTSSQPQRSRIAVSRGLVITSLLPISTMKVTSSRCITSQGSRRRVRGAAAAGAVGIDRLADHRAGGRSNMQDSRAKRQ